MQKDKTEQLCNYSTLPHHRSALETLKTPSAQTPPPAEANAE